MAQTLLSLLLLRRVSPPSPTTRHLLRPLGLCSKPFSTQNPAPDQPKPSSLSARLSFVFDQIDAIEKQRSERHQTLERIRAWRQSKQTQENTPDAQESPELKSRGFVRDNGSYVPMETSSVEMASSNVSECGESKKKGLVELVHPWPEWIELMERLVQQNYFDHRRRNEDKTVQELGVGVCDLTVGGDELGSEIFKDFKAVQTACMNLGKDRFDILRSLSRQDIQILVGYGCPSAERKVTLSAKLLRKRVHLDEGDVCSACSLRNSCEKAYLLTNKEDEARTLDVMRVLFAYGFDPLNGSVVNKGLLKQKSVKTVVRKLLHEIVKLSGVPIDPNLPPPVIKKPAPKVKQPPPPPKKRVGRDDIEMKKGDWLCPKCDFMNFAKNTVCLQCDAKRPKRQLLPGEWECPECNFLNYRRNMTCFHCECKRPPDGFMENKAPEKRHGPRREAEKIARPTDVSNAWNFDFDDDESDGADVAAFEYADTSTMKEDSDGYFRGPGNEYDGSRGVLAANRRDFDDIDEDSTRAVTGFNDFDDEDDVNSYEIDTNNSRLPRRAFSASGFSVPEAFSEPEDIGNDRNILKSHHGEARNLRNTRTKPITHNLSAFSDFESEELESDEDEEVSVNSRWKSSHVASGHMRRNGRSTKLGFGSDEEPGLSSGIEDDYDEKFNTEGGGRGFRRKGRSFSDSESDDDGLGFSAKSSRRYTRGRSTRRFADRRMGLLDNELDRPSRESRGRGKRHGNDLRQRMNGERNRESQNFKGARQGRQGFGSRPTARSNNYDAGYKDRDYGEFRNSRRVIER